MDRVIFVSDAQAEWARECGFCPSDKIGIAEHAGEIEDLLILQKVPPFGTIVFGALARMTVQKGLDVLLEAWKMSEINGQAKLLIGGDGPEGEKLRKSASGLEAVEFLGPVVDRKAFYERCHCIVIPSRWEPYGQVCLEARAAGCPLIVSDVDGLPEQLDSGKCGLIFRSGDIFDLASKMEQMCEMVGVPEQFQRMCLAGRTSSARTRERFLKEFTKLLEPAETHRGSGES